MAVAALSQLTEWGVANVAASLRTVTDELATIATELGLAVLPRAERGPHLVGVRLPDEMRPRVLSALAERGCFAAIRGDALRLAPHLHTSPSDIQRLAEALRSAL